MKRYLWRLSFSEKLSPAYPCPHCKVGTLSILPDTFRRNETVESKEAHDIDGWDPDWIDYTFEVWLKCNSSSCGQEVAVLGKGSQERYESQDEDGDRVQDWRPEFEPLFLRPMPDIFELPEGCPKEVKAELRAAFRLFWADQAASAGRVRVMLERLMDHFRVPKRCKGKDNKFYDLKLHARIEKFSRNMVETGEKLLALKWLGNTASHQGQVSRDDLLHGFEILEYLLAELFDQRSIHVKQLAKQLIKRHAPRRRPGR